jgi:SAM-dependent methyltransferase
LTVRFVSAVLMGVAVSAYAAPLETPREDLFTAEDAQKMIRASEGHLAPVYAPLAEQIVADFDLAGKEGVGVDLGSGPGSLILELCKRTRLHWVNADINPHFFPHFLAKAEAAGMGNRVSAIFADAHLLPFRDDYADIIVSRGCFFFWEDKARAFGEVHRVLKPGGVAYIGRGMARDFPLERARAIRANQKGSKVLKYDPKATAKELREALEQAGITDFAIECPKPEGDPDIHYGVWVTIRKPASAGKK